MTSRDLVLKVIAGEPVSRKPILGYPVSSESDFQIGESGPSEKINLKEVLNPFGRALEEGIDLKKELRENPESSVLDRLIAETKADLDSASNFDGILYRLHGADLSHCSPMQYGGHFLETDRELLASVGADRVTVLVIVAGEGAFIDFVSDLPANIFAWDAPRSGVTALQVRELRTGLLAANDPDADFIFSGAERLVDQLENHLCGSL